MNLLDLKPSSVVFSVKVSTTRFGTYAYQMVALTVLTHAYAHPQDPEKLFVVVEKTNPAYTWLRKPHEVAWTELQQDQKLGNRLFAEEGEANAYIDQLRELNRPYWAVEVQRDMDGEYLPTTDIQIGDTLYQVNVDMRADDLPCSLRRVTVYSQVRFGRWANKVEAYMHDDKSDDGHHTSVYLPAKDRLSENGLTKAFRTLEAAEQYMTRIQHKALLPHEVNVYRNSRIVLVGADPHRIGGLIDAAFETTPLLGSSCIMLESVDFSFSGIAVKNQGHHNWPPTDRWGKVKGRR